MLLLDRQHRAVVSSRGQAHPARSKLMKRSLLARIACLAFALGVTYCFFIQYCDLLFDCGCRALWAGRADNCNIHNAAPPHCPWCLDDGAYGRWAHAAIVIAQAGLALWPGSFGKRRAAAVFLAFPAVGGAAGLLAGLATGYWQ